MRLILDSFATLVFDPSLWLVMLAAVPLGMLFGAVPGLGGKLGIVLSIPLVFGMDTVHGCVFLIAMHSVVHTGGSIPSILLGIPGSGRDPSDVQSGPSWRARNFVTTPGSIARQEAPPSQAATRSHSTPVKARAPPGSSSGTIATWP